MTLTDQISIKASIQVSINHILFRLGQQYLHHQIQRNPEARNPREAHLDGAIKFTQ